MSENNDLPQPLRWMWWTFVGAMLLLALSVMVESDQYLKRKAVRDVLNERTVQ